MKKTRKILALALVFCFAMTSFASAAMPGNTIIFGDRAYDTRLLDNEEYTSQILAAFLSNENSFIVKLPNGGFFGPNLEEKSAEDIPAVVYTNEEGQETEYEANDGDEVVESEELEVVEVSAIDKTVTFDVASLVEDEETATVAFYLVEDEKVAEEAALEGDYDIEEIEDVVESGVVVDVRDLDSGDYKVEVTVGEEEADAEVTLDFEAVDEARDAVNNATNQIKLAEALNKEFFADVYVEANIVAYAESTMTTKNDYETVQEIIDDIKDVNETQATKGEFEVVKAALEDAHPNQLKIVKVLEDNFDDVDADNIDAYEAAIFEDDGTVKQDTLKKIQEAIDNANDNAAAAVVIALIEKLPDEIELKDKEDVEAARAAYEALTEEQQELVTNVGDLETAETDIKNLEAYEAAKAEVYALFVDAKAEDKVLAAGVGQPEITAASEVVDELEVEEHKNELNVLINEANTLFNSIKARLEIDTTYIVSNPNYKDKGRQLGYWVKVSLNNGEGNDELKVADTKDITIKLYNDETLLGEQSLNAVGYEKYADVSALGGTINVFGEYVATSWNHEWYGEVTDIPTDVVATVEYKDGRIVENELKIVNEYSSNEIKFFAVAVTEANTLEEMRNALVDFDVANEGTVYLDLSNKQRLEVAELVLDAIEEDEEVPFADASYVNDILAAAMQLHGEKLGYINSIEATSNTVGVEEALSKFEYEAYDAFTNYADRLAIAENFFNSLHDEDGEFVAPAFKTIAAIEAAIDAAIAGL